MRAELPRIHSFERPAPLDGSARTLAEDSEWNIFDPDHFLDGPNHVDSGLGVVHLSVDVAGDSEHQRRRSCLDSFNGWIPFHPSCSTSVGKRKQVGCPQYTVRGLFVRPDFDQNEAFRRPPPGERLRAAKGHQLCDFCVHCCHDASSAQLGLDETDVAIYRGVALITSFP